MSTETTVTVKPVRGAAPFSQGVASPMRPRRAATSPDAPAADGLPAFAALFKASDARKVLNKLPALGVPKGIDNVQPGASDGAFASEMDNRAYHAMHTHISHSGMLELLRSPKHYRAYLNDKGKDGEVNLYEAAHALILEPERFAREYIAYAGQRRGKPWDAFKEANAGKLILTEVEMARVQGMLEAVKTFEEYPLWEVLQQSKREESIFWIDEESGVPCRVRLDASTDEMIFDVKGIDDARPESVARQISRMGYDLQAAMYRRGKRAQSGKDLPFCFIFIEDRAPFGIWMHIAGETVLADGETKYRAGVKAFKRLQESNDWHGYRGAISTIELPRYLRLKPESDLARAADS